MSKIQFNKKQSDFVVELVREYDDRHWEKYEQGLVSDALVAFCTGCQDWCQRFLQSLSSFLG